jgi:hypothetical protein
MEFEYSQEVKGQVKAFRFQQWEQFVIAKALTQERNKMYKRIERIENDPKNEGQVTFKESVRNITHEIREIGNIIEAMLNQETL